MELTPSISWLGLYMVLAQRTLPASSGDMTDRDVGFIPESEDPLEEGVTHLCLAGESHRLEDTYSPHERVESDKTEAN